jgi:hypothetical protein
MWVRNNSSKMLFQASVFIDVFYLMAASTAAGMLPLDDVRDLKVFFSASSGRPGDE